MNDKLISEMNGQHITSYKLSKTTGIPYTTINELVNRKLNINKCASETVQKIAVVLGINIADILNPIHYVDGVSGKSKGMKYKWLWKEDQGMKFIITDGDKEIEMDAGAQYTNPSCVKDYKNVAELLIKKYNQQKSLDMFTEI